MKLLISCMLVLLASGIICQIDTEEQTEILDGNTDVRPGVTCDEQHSSVATCQNFARYSGHLLNILVNKKLVGSYMYKGMAEYYWRDDVAYRGFGKFFAELAEQDEEHAEKLMAYISKRGGRLHLKPVQSPSKQEFASPFVAWKQALRQEKAMTDLFLDLHWTAQDKNDPHLQDYIESEFLPHHVDMVKKLSDGFTQLRRLRADPVALNEFDEHLREGKMS